MTDSRASDVAAAELYRQALEYEQAGDTEAAIEAWRTLSGSAPTDECYLLSLGNAYCTASKWTEAEDAFRESTFVHPYSELSSKLLFHLLWDRERTDDAFIEMKRFQSIGNSEDYADIVREINAQPVQ